MKHLELFESFQRFRISPQGKLVIGFYSEGGYGAHPGVITLEVFEKIMSFDDVPYFLEISHTNVLPEALVVVFDSRGDGTITPVSKQLASDIQEMIDSGPQSEDGYISNRRIYDEEDLQPTFELIDGIYQMLGYSEEPDHERADISISVILDPKINTIYWSEWPEMEHDVWRPPYEEKAIEDLI